MKKILISLFVLVGIYGQMHSENITLVWRATTESWGEDWLAELLSGFDITYINDPNYEVFIDNAIVVMNLGNARDNEYFAKLDQMNYKYGAIVLSDELYSASTDFYNNAQFIFRNYWHKRFASQKNVHFLPPGYKSGFWAHCSREVKKAQDRELVWSFVGQIVRKPWREEMICAMRRVAQSYVHETFYWKDPRSLPVDQYQNILLNTIFVPCPAGFWNLDSFRVYEALECGCIPIVERKPLDYFGLYLGQHPFLVVDSWDEAPDLINALRADPVQLENRRVACHEWWLAYKEKLKQELATVITDTLLSSKSRY